MRHPPQTSHGVLGAPSSSVRGGATLAHLPLDVQLVLEVLVGRAQVAPRPLPADEAVGRVAAHGDVAGRAVHFCRENAGGAAEPESSLGPTAGDHGRETLPARLSRRVSFYRPTGAWACLSVGTGGR